MIDSRIKLDVRTEVSATFTPLTGMADYTRDDQVVSMASGTDYLYVGFEKPINALYAEFTAPHSGNPTLTLEAHNGTTWASVSNSDETAGFTRSGFVTWDRSDMTSVEVDGDTKYWIRLSFNEAMTFTVRGINIVFADDEALKVEFPNVTDPRIIPAGSSSNIVHHVAARDLIIQKLRNDGNIKYNSNNVKEMIMPWDLLDIYEIREAAKYAALAKIFFILSDDIDDNWWIKHKEYQNMFERTLQAARLGLDTDDDGVEDLDEKQAVRKSVRFTR